MAIKTQGRKLKRVTPEQRTGGWWKPEGISRPIHFQSVRRRAGGLVACIPPMSGR